MRLKYTSFKSLTLKKRIKKKYSKCFRSRTSLRIVLFLEGDTTLCPASNVRGSAFRLLGKEWKNKKKGGRGKKMEEAFVSSTQLTT